MLNVIIVINYFIVIAWICGKTKNNKNIVFVSIVLKMTYFYTKPILLVGGVLNGRPNILEVMINLKIELKLIINTKYK
jgi:hypothetical protein|tara:strand:- start:960 stop:1193 length:234 start_codon:yes stop_codon:yes gene_type:complete